MDAHRDAATDHASAPPARGPGAGDDTGRVLDVPAFVYSEVTPPEEPHAPTREAPAYVQAPAPPRQERQPAPAPPARRRRRDVRRRSPAGGGRSAPAPGANGSLDELTAELVESVGALATAHRSQERELAELRDRMESVRSLLG
jgi:hypothetical protein